MNAIEQIFTRMSGHNTLLCCGLDPDLKKLPREISERGVSNEEKVFDFLRIVVEMTALHVCAYKAQKAFFDMLPGGHEVLKSLISYIHASHKGIPVIVDCKIGDIYNTMEAYTRNLFSVLQADGVVVNPYMGDDVMDPLVEFTDKAIVVLVKTSNLSSGVIQDIPLQNGWPLWQYVLDLVVNRWNQSENMVPVISSTVNLSQYQIRPLVPDKMPILLAGVGAQGGDSSVLSQLVNSEGIGVFINSSRGVLYPVSDQPWFVAVKESAIKLKDSLNQERRVSEQALAFTGAIGSR